MEVPEDVRLRVEAMDGRWLPEVPVLERRVAKLWREGLRYYLIVSDQPVKGPSQPSGGWLTEHSPYAISHTFRDWDALRVGLDWLEENGWPE